MKLVSTLILSVFFAFVGVTILAATEHGVNKLAIVLKEYVLVFLLALFAVAAVVVIISLVKELFKKN